MSIIDHPKIQTAHVPYCMLGRGLSWPGHDLDLPCCRATQYLPSLAQWMFIALIACRDREAKLWRPKSMVYFFPHVLQPGTTHKFLTLPVKQMHHLMKGHGGIDRRSVIYFVHHKIMNAKIFSEVDKWCIDSIIYKVDYTYAWSIIDQMIPSLHEASLEDC